MKKLKYKSDVYALIFTILGATFIMMGCFGFLNIIKPSAHSSVQDPVLLGQIFCFIGIAFCVIQAVLRIFGHKQTKLHNELVWAGKKQVGTVETIALQRKITVGRKSPFIVYYTYSYDGRTCRGKSRLLWDEPNLSSGDKITVFVNDAGRSTVEL